MTSASDNQTQELALTQLTLFYLILIIFLNPQELYPHYPEYQF